MRTRLMKTRFLSLVATFALSVAVLLVGATPASAAYTCFSGGWPSRSFSVKYVGVYTTWEGYYTTARSR